MKSKMLPIAGIAALLAGVVLSAAIVSMAQTTSTSTTATVSARRVGVGLQPTASGTMGTTAQMLYWPGVCSSIEFQNRTGQIAYITFDGRTPSASSCDAVVANGADFRDFPRIAAFSVVFVTGGTYTLGANPGVVCTGWLENPAQMPIAPTPVEPAGLTTYFALKAGQYEVGFNAGTPTNQPYSCTYWKWNDRFTMRNSLNAGSANYTFGNPHFFSITAPATFTEGGNDSGWGHGELVPAIDSPRVFIDGKRLTGAVAKNRLYEAASSHCELQTTTYLDDGDTRVAQVDHTWWVTPFYIRYRTTVKLLIEADFDSNYPFEAGFCADAALATTRTVQYANFVAYLTGSLTLSGPHTVGTTNTAYLNDPYICGFYSSVHGLVTIIDFRNTATAQLTGAGDVRDTNCYIFNNATSTSKFYWEGNWLTEADNTTAGTEATWEVFITTKGATSGTYQALTSGSPTPTELLALYYTGRTE